MSVNTFVRFHLLIKCTQTVLHFRNGYSRRSEWRKTARQIVTIDLLNLSMFRSQQTFLTLRNIYIESWPGTFLYVHLFHYRLSGIQLLFAVSLRFNFFFSSFLFPIQCRFARLIVTIYTIHTVPAIGFTVVPCRASKI